MSPQLDCQDEDRWPARECFTLCSQPLMGCRVASRICDQNAYRNADANGTYHFPGFGLAAVEWLLVNRDIRCIGVDTLSLDPGNSTTFSVHRTLLCADRYGVENLVNLKSIPA